MKNPLVITVIVAIVVAAISVGVTFFVMKTERETLTQEIVACEEARAQSEAQVITWEQRFDRESTRWEGLESNIMEQVPKAVNELHAERERIVQMVPEQVKEEVTEYLDNYFTTVMSGFDRMADQYSDVRLQLDTTNQVLASLGTDTTALRATVEGALSDEMYKRDAERLQREGIAQRLGEILANVKEFDQTRINCKSCPDRLRLSRKEREAITAFHDNVAIQLSTLQAETAR